MNRLIDSKQFLADDTYIYNIPNHTLNLILDYRFNDHWSINGEWQYIGNRLSPIDISLNGQPVSDPFPNSGVDYQVPDNILDAVNLLNTRLAWQASPQLELALEVRNLFDKQWQQGGTTLHPYPQEGRWWQLAAEYRW
jgi:iron complex outermembrane receptor protein